MYQIHNGDCAEVMASMGDDSVDAIVTDPPYGLAFMGVAWDTFNDGRKGGSRTNATFDQVGGNHHPTCAADQARTRKSENEKFQERMTPIFAEALRVAKPGAHLLCFGGTRTFHRMACAIEDAGWEIRDCIMWVYGCLDEETEVLVDGEFVPYNKAKKGRLALGYDIGTGNFSWQRIEDTYLYDYDDTAYAIQSDCTDQLVSRNHRCIVERGGVEQFALAELVALEREASVPVLEGLHGLFDHLPLPDEGAGDAKQDMLERVRCGDSADTNEEAQGSRTEHDLSCMRQKVLRASCVAEESQDELLLGELQKQSGVRPEVDGVQHGTSNANVRGTEADTQRANDWLAESRMERRCNVSQAPRELCEREVHSMPQGVRVDGSQGWLRDGASSCGGESDRQAADADRMRPSHQPRSAGQQTRELDAVPDEQCAQALRGAWGTKTTLARVTPVHYEGKMWCIKVATGAFVARRHGKIFITGNSGFPKSMDVAKAIDKASGYVGEVIGERTVDVGMQGGHMHAGRKQQQQQQVRALSDQAREWEGWGTCLKPAWEPIIVARKPLDGTVVSNVLKWGTGALNIDGCRVPIGHGDDVFAKNPHTHSKGKDSGIYGRYNEQQGNWSGDKGRFPANVLHDGSQMVLELFPDTQRADGHRIRRNANHDNVYGGYTGKQPSGTMHSDLGGSAARFFYCAKASKKDRGEGNHHPTVKPTALMEWLVTLVTPQGGVVLDPFAGSGTTLVACERLGFDSIGIEREPEYVEIIKRRLGEE